MKNIVHLIDCMEFMATLPDKAYDLAIVDPPYGIKINMNWDTARPSPEYFNMLMRISKNQIIWGGNYFADLLPASRCWIFWDKLKTVKNYADGELAWTSFDENVRKFVRRLNGAVGREPCTIHPTQKPIALYKWLLTHYAKPGQTIFDSHVGSGSIRIACHDLGFDFEGCEIDADYWQAQEDRYLTHCKQADLIGAEEVRELVYKDGILI